MRQFWYKLSTTLYFYGNFKPLMILASFYFLSFSERIISLNYIQKRDGEIKYPLIKRDTSLEKSQYLQTLAQDDLKSRSDFVFAVSTMILDATTRNFVTEATTFESRLPCISNDLHSYAVVIIAEAKAIASLANNALAKIQWSSVAYMQIMDRISIACEATYANNGKHLSVRIFNLWFNYQRMEVELDIEYSRT